MAQRIGIDVGGTNVKIALVSDKGKIIYSNSIPTRAEMGYEYTINSMKDAIRDLLKETKMKAADIEGIGFGFPGQIDCKKGVVRLAPNIPGWVNVPIASIMEKEFGIPTRVDNDVRTAALGELNYGAGVGCENLVCITVGTGIGSGLVINSKLVRGADNNYTCVNWSYSNLMDIFSLHFKKRVSILIVSNRLQPGVIKRFYSKLFIELSFKDMKCRKFLSKRFI